jgi:DNA-directed RNA polymerase specialized sigma24 family protein
MASRYDGSQTADSVEQDLRREIELLLSLPPARKPTAAQLGHAVRLLLLARSHRERSVVALHVYQGLELEAVAAALALPLGQVKDVFASLCVRERQALHWLENQSRLARLLAPPGTPCK